MVFTRRSVVGFRVSPVLGLKGDLILSTTSKVASLVQDYLWGKHLSRRRTDPRLAGDVDVAMVIPSCEKVTGHPPKLCLHSGCAVFLQSVITLSVDEHPNVECWR